MMFLSLSKIRRSFSVTFSFFYCLFVKVKDDIERHSRELVDLASDLDVDVSTSNMQSCASEVREHAKSISFFPCNLSDILLSVLSLPISS